jgi:hypothetical protein
MSRDISERDWKVFRELHKVALERLCDRILAEARIQVDDLSKSPHERYVNLYQLIQNRNKDVTRAFDDFRRSTAVMQIGIIHKMGLFTKEELKRFSPETLEIVAIYAPIPDA